LVFFLFFKAECREFLFTKNTSDILHGLVVKTRERLHAFLGNAAVIITVMILMFFEVNIVGSVQ